MGEVKNKIENFLSKYCIYIFAIITLIMTLNHTPFWDETHAFEIARLKLSQIFYLTRIEGHPILWYLILKPFSSLKLYPYSMWIINWLFSVGAIYVLWKKAPFSPLIKTFITFSVPIVWIYTPIARCYTIGILLLFLICANYEKRFEKPILYSFLIVLASNTSILATIGSFYLGLIYFFEIIAKTIKSSFSKKNFLLVFLIFLLCAFLLLVQFASTRQPDLLFAEQFFRSVMNFTLLPVNIKIFPAILRIFGMITIYYFIFLGFKNDKKGLFFISATYLTLTYLFLNIYSGSQWNHCFYFIYFIVFMWIFGKNFLTNKFSKFLFFIILFLFMFPKAVFESGKIDMIYDSNSKQIANHIIKNENYRNSKLYTLEWWNDVAPGSTGYLAKNNIFIYDLHNRKRNSFESIKDIFDLKYEPINFDDFYENMDKNSYLIATGILLNQTFISMLVESKPNGDYIFTTKKRKYHLKLIEKLDFKKVSFYKIYEI